MASETYSKYSVPPWSRFGTRRTTSDKPQCAICNRVIKSTTPHHAIVVKGGAEWGDLSSDENDPGYMGAFDIGPDCHKRFVVKDEAPK